MTRIVVGALLFLLIVVGIWFYYQKKQKTTHPLLWGFSVEGFPITKTQLENLKQETKIVPQILQFYVQWPTENSKEFKSVSSTLNAIEGMDAIPCMTWEPMTITGDQEKMIPYEFILNGSYDKYLIFIAGEIKKWNKPIIIRFAQEMNLQRYHWGTSQEQFGEKSPEIYIKMYRYLISLFNANHVDNVLWAFCPNVDSVPDSGWNKVENYYPGDEYVDVLGMDGYNWAMTPEIASQKQLSWIQPWRSFKEIFQSLYHQLKHIAPHLPIVVFETSTAHRNGNNKTQWLKEALETAQEWGLWAIIWFQVNKEVDWRIQQGQDFSYIPLIQEVQKLDKF